MVKLEYVKRKKRKIGALILSGITGTVVAVFVLIAFLGQHVGSFTIKLQQNGVKLTMPLNQQDQDGSTYLVTNSLPRFDFNTNNRLLNHDKLDNEKTSYLDDGAFIDAETNEPVSLYYFKYTFYVRNIGTVPARYNFTINLTDNTRPSNVNYGYDDLLRIRVYENNGDIPTDHNYTTYAKRVRTGGAIYYDDLGNPIYQETIAGDPSDSDFPGFAEMFENEVTLVNRTNIPLDIGGLMRYTVMFWLEGTDSQCVGDTVPEGGSLKMEVRITANEA